MKPAKRRALRLAKPLRARILAGHPWIYDRALAPAKGVEAGELVTIADERGPIACAIADPTSPIRARVLDLDPDAACDDAWATARVESSARRRARDPLLEGCTGRRLVHGEGDACAGLVVDVYADTAVIVLDGPAATAFWRPRLPAVLAGLERGGAAIAHAWLRGERGQRAAGQSLRGNAPERSATTAASSAATPRARAC